MSHPTTAWIACFAVAWCVPAPSAAQDPEDQARELFLQGRTEVQQGDIESGCRKLLESHRMVPDAIGPLLNVADCDEQAGRVATAWRRFSRAVELIADDDHRRDYAQKRAVALEPRVPRVQLELPPGAPEGTRVTQSGADLDEPALSAPLWLDPGSHRFVVRAPGHRDRAYEVVLTERMTHRISLQLGEAAPATAPAPSPPAPEPPAPRREPDDRPSGRALGGWITGGFGAAAIVVGIVTGALVAVHARTYRDHCDDSGGCDPEGRDAAAAGKPLAIVSPVSFAVGGVALAVAIPLLLTSPEMSAGRAPLRVAGDGTFGLFVDGSF